MKPRRADLSPPLGVGGGPCKVVDRIRQKVRNVRDQEALIRLVEDNKDLTNPQVALIYPSLPERGPAPFTKLELRSHAQYRMDLRGITVPDVQNSMTTFRNQLQQVRERLDKVRGQVSALSPKDRKFLDDVQNNPKFDWEDDKAHRTLVLGPEPRAGRVDVITAWTPAATPVAPAGGCPSPSKVAARMADYRAPAGDLTGYRTFVSEKPAKGIDSPLGDSVYHSPGESPRSDRERALPEYPSTRDDLVQKTPANPVYNTPPASNKNDGEKIHVRTPGVPGEDYGHPYKENIYPRRTDDASPGSRAAGDVTAEGGIFPSYNDKQKKQQSEAKLYAKKYYLRHRGKIKSRAKIDYLHKRHSPEFKKEKSRRNSPEYGWRFKRIPSGGFRSNAERAEADRERSGKKAQTAIAVTHDVLGVGYVRDIYDQDVVFEQTNNLDQDTLGCAGIPFFDFLRGAHFGSEEALDAFFELADADFDYQDEEAVRLSSFYRETYTPGSNMDPGPGAQDLGALSPYAPFNPSDNHYTWDQDEKDDRKPGEVMNNIGPTDNNPGSAKVIPEGHDFANRMAVRVAAKMADILNGLDPDLRTRARGIAPKIHKSDDAKRVYHFKVPGSQGIYTVKVQGLKGDVPLAKTDLKVSCTCGFWRWQGPEHWAKVGGYLLGNPVGTASNPNAKDPKGENRVCKHVFATLNHIKRQPAGKW